MVVDGLEEGVVDVGEGGEEVELLEDVLDGVVEDDDELEVDEDEDEVDELEDDEELLLFEVDELDDEDGVDVGRLVGAWVDVIGAGALLGRST